MKNQSRRRFLKAAVGSVAGLAVFPTIIPARLLGADAPSKKINVAQIGCGRLGRNDLGNVLAEPLARVVAVCDLDSKRFFAGKEMAEDYYLKQGELGVNVKA
jgi:myo-inositol 2-dehydrogenase / D-chiro-inositol 1-dehydrogenase